MPRRPVLWILVCVSGSTGCAGTWDKVSSNKFRNDPMGTLFDRRDPIAVLRTSPEGDERAEAMRKLKEPLANGRSQQEQDEALTLLGTAATSDSSPVVRVAAIDALGRFQDPRAAQHLTTAFYQAGGHSPIQDVSQSAMNEIQTVGGRQPVKSAERLGLNGPSGFPPEVVSLLQVRTVKALADSGRPEAVGLLSRVATGGEPTVDRDARLAAVRGLGSLRTPEAVTALSQVLTSEKGRDPALAGRAHEGLVQVTGRQLSDDPKAWDQLVRGGQVPIANPPSGLQQAVGWIIGN